MEIVHRIPLELQKVFLASNGASNEHGDVDGIEAIKAPPRRVAFKVFKIKKLLKGLRRNGSTDKSKDSVHCDKKGASTTTGSDESQTCTIDHSSCQNKPNDEMPASKPETPHQHLERLLASRGYRVDKYKALQTSIFNSPTPLQLASFDRMLVSLIVEQQDEDALRKLLLSGISLNACNKHGESLIHTCCRKGFHRLVKVFLDEGAEIKICDRQGRTLLHDTCWGSRPSFQTFSLIVRQEPILLFMTDARGYCPLDYVRKDHYMFWADFLDRMADEFWPVQLKGIPPVPPYVFLKPHSRPIPDPINALPIDVASMVASGRLSVEEAKCIMRGEETEDRDACSMDDDSASNEDDELFLQMHGLKQSKMGALAA